MIMPIFQNDYRRRKVCRNEVKVKTIENRSIRTSPR